MRVRHPLGSMPYHHEDWLRNEIEVKGRTHQEIADEFGVVRNTIGYFAHKYGIQTPNERHQRKGVYVGPNSHKWQGGVNPYSGMNWNELARALKEQAGHTCQQCGKRPKPRALDVHHRDGNRRNNEPSNLIVLCRSCHNRAHGTLPPWQRRKKDEPATPLPD